MKCNTNGIYNIDPVTKKIDCLPCWRVALAKQFLGPMGSSSAARKAGAGTIAGRSGGIGLVG